MGFKNNVYELEKEYWVELPDEFIGIYKDNFGLVKKEKNSFKVYSDDIKTVSKEELYKNSTDFVMLFEKSEENPKQNDILSSWFLYSVLGLALAYSAIFLNWQNTISISFLLQVYFFHWKFSIKNLGNNPLSFQEFVEPLLQILLARTIVIRL